MKRILIICLFLLSILAGCSTEEKVIDTGNFEDLEAGIISRKSEYGERIYIKKNAEYFEIEMEEMNPWKIGFFNIDGGEIELVLGVYKESPHHPVMAKRIFFYNLGEGRIIPKYRMSRLSYPFVDYIMYDIDSDGLDEIIAIEIMADGSHALGGYNWRNFSFERSYGSDEILKDVSFTKELPKIIIDDVEYSLYLDSEILRWK